jgi:hypothetical protein
MNNKTIKKSLKKKTGAQMFTQAFIIAKWYNQSKCASVDE